jgi:hypothetical protein
MSTRWPGGIINQTAPVPSGPYQDSTAPGVWTLEQQAYLKQQGLWPIPGNINPSAFIENLFSTYLYSGTSASQTINNGINLSGKGGLVWIKGRNFASNHWLADTVRGNTNYLRSSTDGGQLNYSDLITAFNSNGFSLGADSSGDVNSSGGNYCSWTFAEQPKFFDVVTYTGNGASERQVSHSLGSAPGMVIVKSTSNTSNWAVWHRSLGATSNNMYLNLTAANGANADFSVTGAGTMSSTSFCVSSTLGVTNANGQTYVAYLFAHNAGGFGTSGTDNVISCDSFTCNGSGFASVNLGYEPQYLLVKRTDGANNWWIADNMRGLTAPTSNYQMLQANTVSSEAAATNLNINSTGFTSNNAGLAGMSFIYMAIRRPMAVPTVATTVFNPVYGQSGAPGFRSSNFNAGMDTSFAFLTSGYNDGTNAYQNLQARLTGLGQVQTGNGRAEVSQSYNLWDYMNGQNNTTFYSPPWGSWLFKRASGFHDVVCYTGTGANRTVTHNLGVAPELMIIKNRSSGTGWVCYAAPLTATQVLPLTDAVPTTNPFVFLDTEPTSSVFTVGAATSGANGNGSGIIAYLFATCPGVSKVGSYTGNGALTTINCGFTGGARFVLIKRTDSTGDWYVWDTTRGMIAGTNPSLTLNTYAAEVNANSVYTIATGFQLLASPAVPVNNSGASYIFLAIA